MKRFFLPVLYGALSALLAYAQVPSFQPSTSHSVSFPANSAKTPVTDLATLPSVPPLPQGKTTLLGGTITRLDRIRDELTLHVFGRSEPKILFDGRTSIHVNGQIGTPRDLKNNQRVHIDTMLDGTKVFARAIYILTPSEAMEDYGPVISYNANTGEMVMTDALFGVTVKLWLTRGAVIHRQNGSTLAGLRRGSLVKMNLRTDQNGRAVADEVFVLAEPGELFSFTGHVSYIDLSSRMIVIESPNKQSYELYCDRTLVPAGLHEGADIEASAEFKNNHYVVTKLTVVQ